MLANLSEVVFKGLGFKGLGFKGLGFKGLGFKGLGFKGLGFKGLGRLAFDATRDLFLAPERFPGSPYLRQPYALQPFALQPCELQPAYCVARSSPHKVTFRMYQSPPR